MSTTTHKIRRDLRGQKGFLLPVVIILFLAVSMLGVVNLQAVTSTSNSLNSQLYNQLAREAAQAGSNAATACLADNKTGWSTLTPSTTCTGATNGSSYVASRDNMTSRYVVTKSSAVYPITITSTGYTELRNSAGAITQTFPQTVKKVINAGSSTGVVDVATGGEHTCAIAGGKVYCWGSNNLGQLGVGDNTDRFNPTQVSPNVGDVLYGKTVTDVDLSADRTCAIVAPGDVYCWGSDLDGGIGRGTSRTDTNVPQKVNGQLNGKTVTKLAMASNNANASCALVSVGDVYCWGSNFDGQLGTGSTTIGPPAWGVFTPTKLSTTGINLGGTVTDIAMSNHSACAIASAKVYCWGNNWGPGDCSQPYGPIGLFGIGDTCSTNRPYPQPQIAAVDIGNNTPTKVTGGGITNCVIASSKAYCWGSGYGGAIGNNIQSDQARPQPVYTTAATNPMNQAVTDIDVDSATPCAVSGGKAYCWGANGAGEMGTHYGSGGNGYFPYLVDGTTNLNGKTVTKVSTGYQHLCAIADGAIYCWGNNRHGKLGNGTATDSTPYNGPMPTSSALLSTPNSATYTPGTSITY